MADIDQKVTKSLLLDGLKSLISLLLSRYPLSIAKNKLTIWSVRDSFLAWLPLLTALCVPKKRVNRRLLSLFRPKQK